MLVFCVDKLYTACCVCVCVGGGGGVSACGYFHCSCALCMWRMGHFWFTPAAVPLGVGLVQWCRGQRSTSTATAAEHWLFCGCASVALIQHARVARTPYRGPDSILLRCIPWVERWGLGGEGGGRGRLLQVTAVTAGWYYMANSGGGGVSLPCLLHSDSLRQGGGIATGCRHTPPGLWNLLGVTPAVSIAEGTQHVSQPHC